MPKNIAEQNYHTLRADARNWDGLIATLNAADWEIEPETTGEELGRVMIALVNNANRDEEEAEDPLIASLAMAYEAFGLDEPPAGVGWRDTETQNEIAATVSARHPASRWGLQRNGEG